jgi:hypothetical protein
MKQIDTNLVKFGSITKRIPKKDVATYRRTSVPPRVGDVILARVLRIGRHTHIENRNGRRIALFPGDLLCAVFGNRYATDQYEGVVPGVPVDRVALLSQGCVCGKVRSKNLEMPNPTRLDVLGYVYDESARKVNLKNYSITPASSGLKAHTILVVGSSMNSGKTTTAATIINLLRLYGKTVCSAKVTGTACRRDILYMQDAGARKVLDFTACGYPSTSLCTEGELLYVFETIYSRLLAAKPDFIVLEVADGLFQRETEMLLALPQFRERVDCAFFSGADSMAALAGRKVLQERFGIPVLGISGKVANSELGMREVETHVGLPCFNPLHENSRKLYDILRGFFGAALDRTSKAERRARREARRAVAAASA